MISKCVGGPPRRTGLKEPGCALVCVCVCVDCLLPSSLAGWGFKVMNGNLDVLTSNRNDNVSAREVARDTTHECISAAIVVPLLPPISGAAGAFRRLYLTALLTQSLQSL